MWIDFLAYILLKRIFTKMSSEFNRKNNFLGNVIKYLMLLKLQQLARYIFLLFGLISICSKKKKINKL